jgi:hypothetical protein
MHEDKKDREGGALCVSVYVLGIYLHLFCQAAGLVLVVLLPFPKKEEKDKTIYHALFAVAGCLCVCACVCVVW